MTPMQKVVMPDNILRDDKGDALYDEEGFPLLVDDLDFGWVRQSIPVEIKLPVTEPDSAQDALSMRQPGPTVASTTAFLYEVIWQKRIFPASEPKYAHEVVSIGFDYFDPSEDEGEELGDEDIENEGSGNDQGENQNV